LKSGLAAVAAVICVLHPVHHAVAQQTTLIQPSLGQPGYNSQPGMNAALPYVPQQQSSQNMYNNGYNAMQNATLSQPGGQQQYANQNQSQQTQIKYFYRGGVNDAHPLRPEELPQRLFHNCPCKDYSSDYPTVVVIKVP